jgi:hypothetical protein
MIISAILILNMVFIFIMIKFEKKYYCHGRKTIIWFEMIKNYKNLGRISLILLLLLLLLLLLGEPDPRNLGLVGASEPSL